ncbi:hypothetical protein [Actinacidiphila sp. bgisy167]|uniref:hypothetical protein n=1 Tax=Actinacidiphila sp. bgisy167 TaxID=3413797 RepID=UPI003D709CDE
MFPSPTTGRPARVDASSPLMLLEESFLALASAEDPLTLPAHLVCAEPEQDVLPVDQVRARLAHPATSREQRARTWQEVVRRAQRLGEPWGTVAVGLSVPVLRRMLARQVRPVHLEWAELEQEALAAVAVAVQTVDVGRQVVDRELFAAANRAVQRTLRTARVQARHQSRIALGLLPAGCPDPSSARDEDEYAVLARAVQAHAVNVAEARLIARTRLEGEPMQRLADERGVSLRQLYRHRTAAEQHLAAYLTGRMRSA